LLQHPRARPPRFRRSLPVRAASAGPRRGAFVSAGDGWDWKLAICLAIRVRIKGRGSNVVDHRYVEVW